MEKYLESTISCLEKLVAFKSVSGLSNLDLIGFIDEQLQAHGVATHISYDETGQRANLHALVGPAVAGGVVLNGHSDVVPVEGQKWSGDPYILRRRDGRLYARGAVDMKGFVACMLAAVPMWQQKKLQKPIHISICYDEENGGFGAPVLVADICEKVPRPAIAIVGEPTQMQIVTTHKGGYEMRTEITGLETHSSNPSAGVSAIAYANRFIAFLLDMAEELTATPQAGSKFDPAYPTINVGTIQGGVARNTVAGWCGFDWELRKLPNTDGDALIKRINDYAMNVLLPQMRKTSPDANIVIEMQADVPGLDHEQADRATRLVSRITGLNSTHAVPFATDAGHFSDADVSTIVMGPGNIEQAHKPDEFIEISQLEACLEFFDKLGDELTLQRGEL